MTRPNKQNRSLTETGASAWSPGCCAGSPAPLRGLLGAAAGQDATAPSEARDADPKARG